MSEKIEACVDVEYVYLTVRESSNSGKGHSSESGGQLDDIWQYANYTATAAEAATLLLQCHNTAYAVPAIVKEFQKCSLIE